MNNSSVSDPSTQALPLLPHHLQQLSEASGIAPEIIKARGYRSIHGDDSYSQLKALGFNRAQCRLAPGLLVPYLDTDGTAVLYQFRPDTPRRGKDGKPIKYETPAGASMRLDCGVGQAELLKYPSVPLWITEGAKKGDALRTQALCAVVLLGVHNFKGKNRYGGVTFLADWDYVAVNGREVRIVYDSDVMTKAPVRDALERLTEHLQRREAHVVAVYLPTEAGQKVGVDDYLRTHTVQQLEGLVEQRRPTPEAAKSKVELLAAAPQAITRPLRLIGGRAYAAAWLWTRTTTTEIQDKNGEIRRLVPPLVVEGRRMFIVRDDGVVFAGVEDLKIKPLTELGLTVHLPEIPQDARLWSAKGVTVYRRGERPDPVEVFRKVVAVIDRFMDFKRSLASQQTMCELVACYVISTYVLDAFNVIGYLWPNGDKGVGKTNLLHVVCELGYLGQVVLAGGSYASLRNMADYGATLAFDDAEAVMDKRRGDPDKQALLLAGNRRGSQVTVQEPTTERTWRTRYVNTFAPRLFSAIRLPNDVLGSHTITIPLVRSIDADRANADPLDYELWPHDRTELIDELWAMALAHLAALKKYDTQVAHKARLGGRNLEPWRAILAVAAWLDTQDTSGALAGVYHDPEDNDQEAERTGGLYARMEALSVAYQAERSDLEAYDPTRLLIKALQAISDKCHVDPIELSSGELAAEMNRLAIEDEIAGEDEKFTNPQRVGRLLERLRFRKGQRSGTKRRWRVSREELKAHARGYGMGGLP